MYIYGSYRKIKLGYHFFGPPGIVTFNLQTESVEFASNSSIIIIPQLVVTSSPCPHNQSSSWPRVSILDVQEQSIHSNPDEVVCLAIGNSI